MLLSLLLLLSIICKFDVRGRGRGGGRGGALSRRRKLPDSIKRESFFELKKRKREKGEMANASRRYPGKGRAAIRPVVSLLDDVHSYRPLTRSLLVYPPLLPPPSSHADRIAYLALGRFHLSLLPLQQGGSLNRSGG